MAGLDPAIQTDAAGIYPGGFWRRRLDGRVKPGHDGSGVSGDANSAPSIAAIIAR
jgi:hypothetical protein